MLAYALLHFDPQLPCAYKGFSIKDATSELSGLGPLSLQDLSLQVVARIRGWCGTSPQEKVPVMDFAKNVISSLLPTAPDPSLREPITFSAVAPLFACYYALALLVQLPRTFVFRLSLLPIAIWSGWHAATRYDLALRVALMLGWEEHWEIQGLNFALVVSGWYNLFFCMPFSCFVRAQ